MRNIIYVAGPYSATTIEKKMENIDKAVRQAKTLTLLGYCCIVPHKLTELWDFDTSFSEWEDIDWLEKCCYPLLYQCRALFLTDGWQKSEGCLKELDFAREHNIPYFTSERELLRNIRSIQV